MATRQSDYAKWYYENYTKKGLKISRKESSLTNVASVNIKSQRSSIVGLNDSGKTLAKNLKSSLTEQRKTAQDKLKNNTQSKIDSLRQKIKVIGRKGSKDQKDALRAQIKDLQSEYKEGKAKIKKQFDASYVKQLENIKLNNKYQNENSIAGLNEKTQSRLKTYKAELNANSKAQKESLDKALKEFKEKNDAEIANIKESVVQAKETKKKAEESHKESMSKRISDLRAKIMALSPYERGLQRESLIAEIKALQTENVNGKQKIKDDYVKANSESKTRIKELRESYKKAKSENSESKKKITAKNKAKYKKRVSRAKRKRRNLKGH